MSYPPLPPTDDLRFEDDDLVLRLAEAEDADTLYSVLIDDRTPFLRDADRPNNLEQYRSGVKAQHLQQEAGVPAHRIQWVLEASSRPIGLLNCTLQFLDKEGKRSGSGLKLRTATFMAYFGPDFVNQGYGQRGIQLFEFLIDKTLSQYFGIEQIVVWIEDSNAAARALTAVAKFEGPIHHDRDVDLGMYRRALTRVEG